MLCSERFRTYGSGRPEFATRLSGTVARRRMVLEEVVLETVEMVVKLDVAVNVVEVMSDGVVAFAVSAAENENAFVSLFSIGPAESGGVAVIVLGNRNSCKLATAGEIGCAVRGVSGNNVEAYGVCVPC